MTAGERLQQATWPASAAEEALIALAHASGMSVVDGFDERPSRGTVRGPGLDTALNAAADRHGLELEPTHAAPGEAHLLVRGCAPALLTIPGDRAAGLLAVLRRRGNRLALLTPGLRRVSVRAEEVASVLTRKVVEEEQPVVDGLLDAAGVPRGGRRRRRAERALIAARLGAHRIGGCWLLRLPPGAGFRGQAEQERLPRYLAAFLGTYGVSYALLLGSWWMLGWAVLEGRLSTGWLGAWALILALLVPFRALSVWSRVRLTVGFGSLFKRRLLQGALRLAPEETRHQGAGQLLGRVIESESVETLALNGGFLSVVAVIELAFAVLVLAAGAAGAVHVAAFTAWLAVTVWVGWRFLQARANWTETRVLMTDDLAERMVGHRTRLAQESRKDWHLEEDLALSAYHRESARFDRSKTVLLGLVGRGWLVIGVAALLPAFLAGDDRLALAVGLGGVLVAYRGFVKLSEGFNHLSGALVAWRQAQQLFRAAARREVPAALAVDGPAGSCEGRENGPILEALDLSFRHRGRPRATLDGCHLEIRRGETILLQGQSGGGKSTLAALLAGLRRPDSGLLLLRGLDLGTLGAQGWRRRVVVAPQFHENHVLTETFAFNLLLGRRWPADPADLAEAVAVCRELGLGEVLERMPSGLNQPIGETGWQLSHGEKSRLYIARALLQGGDLVVLDESFAALDPTTLDRALTCVLRRASTLLIIAHP